MQGALPASTREDFQWVPMTKDRKFVAQYNAVRARENSLKVSVERQHLISIVSENKALLECDPLSMANVLTQGALTGLSLDPNRKHLYVSSYNVNTGKGEDNKPVWVKMAKIGIYYQGIMHLAYGSDLMTNLQADIVYQGDKYEYGRNQDGPWFEHVPRKKQKDRGEAIGVYCYAKFKRHGAFFDYMVVEDINKIKTFILAQQKKPDWAGADWKPKLSGAWTSWEFEKWKISVIRRCSKQWPKDDALMRTLAVLDTVDDEIQFEDNGDIRQADEPEYLCVSESELDELHDMITAEFPGEDSRAVNWLESLASKMLGDGVSITALPANRFEEASNLIQDRLNKVIDARAEAKAPPEETLNGDKDE